MGYHEIHCFICRASFNIARRERPDEPAAAGWDYSGPKWRFENWRGDEDRVPEHLRPDDDEGLEADDDRDDDDQSFVYSSADEQDPLEFDSNADSSDVESSAVSAGAGEDDDSYEQHNDSDGESFRGFWRRTLVTNKRARKLMAHPTERNDNLQSWYRSLPPTIAHDIEQEPAAFYEEKTSAYDGRFISVEEMRGCNTSQCLVSKALLNEYLAPYEPEFDDEDFEIRGTYVLSGLNDFMLSIEASPRVTPARHGCALLKVDDYIIQGGLRWEFALPFHPTCFEIYKRATLLELGVIDVEGLIKFWLMSSTRQIHRWRRHADVESNDVQWWSHEPGTEYLAANPLFIPSFDSILEAAQSTDLDFNSQNSAFAPLPSLISSQTTSTADPFRELPAELRLQILSHLSSKDVAALRLASRAFHDLPISLFYTLILDELPWLWEAWPENLRRPYSYWATATQRELEAWNAERDTNIRNHTDYVTIVSAEMPELRDSLQQALAVYKASIRDAEAEARRKVVMPASLCPRQTNWYKLYLLITRNWKNLKGLRNRDRIWYDCDDISSQIDNCRREGVIPML